MPADDLYWNPMDLDSDESIPYPKQYIDPWDLENYAYIRQHLDSVDLNSDPSSLGEPQETAFYYVPAKPDPRPNYPPMKPGRHQEDFYYSPHNKYESLMRSEHGTANYAAIDEVVVRNEGVGFNRRKNSKMVRRGMEMERYERGYIDEPDYETENPYAIGTREEASMQLYESSKPRRKRSTAKNIAAPQKSARTHRNSISVGDEYDPYGRIQPVGPIYNGMEDIYVKPDYYDSAGTSPIYDDIRVHRSKPNNFKLSNYGHLEIDYSCSWNNLNKYIYN